MGIGRMAEPDGLGAGGASLEKPGSGATPGRLPDGGLRGRAVQSCLICDDHALFRDALATSVASRWPAARIVQADSFDAAWASAAAAAPELCLVDLMMPGAGPVEGVSRVLRAAPDARILVITGAHDDSLLLALLDKGVHGFVQKTSTGDVILAAIELVLAGGRYLPPRVAELALARKQPGTRCLTSPAVSDRQREILRLVAEGHSNKEIARALHISPATVKTHVANVIAAIGAANRTEAATRARTMGVI